MPDPWIKKEDGYFVYGSGSENYVWVHKSDGTPFVGIIKSKSILFQINMEEFVRINLL
jgi:hypothetical protein